MCLVNSIYVATYTFLFKCVNGFFDGPLSIFLALLYSEYITSRIRISTGINKMYSAYFTHTLKSVLWIWI